MAGYAYLRDQRQSHELASFQHKVAQIGQMAAARFTDQQAVIDGLQAIAGLVKTV